MATKIKLKQLDREIIDLLGGGGSLIRDIVSNVTVGAAPSGTKFPKGQELTGFAEMILRKDIIPTITTTFSGSGIKEKGTTVNGTTMKLTISNLNIVTVPIDKVDFYVGSTIVDTQTFVTGQSVYQFVYNTAITDNTSVKAVLTYSTNKTTTGTDAFTFVYGSYSGLTTVATMDDAIATGFLTSFTKNIKNAKGFTWNNIAANDQKFCYMYPVSFGALSSIKDGNNFEQLGSYTRYQVNVTYPTDGATIPYYVYLLTDAVTGTGFKQVYS